MNEIYWITRFDAINTVVGWCCVFAVIAFIVGVIGWIITKSDIAEYQHDGCFKSELEQAKCMMQVFTKLLRYGCTVGAICLTMYALLPTTKEAFVIYGIGGTIDYVKSSDKAKELPDKVVEALTRYVDTIAKEQE